MAATTNPADKSFSVVIERLLEKATPGTPRLASERCACVRRIRSVDRTNISLFARNRRGALASDVDSSSDRELRALVTRGRRLVRATVEQRAKPFPSFAGEAHHLELLDRTKVRW